MITHKIAPHSTTWGPIERAPHYGRGRTYHRTPADEWNDMHPPATRIIPFHEQSKVDITDFQGHTTKHVVGEHTSKLVYTTWVSQQPFKRGDWVVPKSAIIPYIKQQYGRVFQLQEVQMLLKFDHKGRPMALDVITVGGTRFSVSPDDWKVVDAPVDTAWHFDLPAF